MDQKIFTLSLSHWALAALTFMDSNPAKKKLRFVGKQTTLEIVKKI